MNTTSANNTTEANVVGDDERRTESEETGKRTEEEPLLQKDTQIKPPQRLYVAYDPDLTKSDLSSGINIRDTQQNGDSQESTTAGSDSQVTPSGDLTEHHTDSQAGTTEISTSVTSNSTVISPEKDREKVSDSQHNSDNSNPQESGESNSAEKIQNTSEGQSSKPRKNHEENIGHQSQIQGANPSQGATPSQGQNLNQPKGLNNTVHQTTPNRSSSTKQTPTSTPSEKPSLLSDKFSLVNQRGGKSSRSSVTLAPTTTTIFLRLFVPDFATTEEPHVGHVQQEKPGSPVDIPRLQKATVLETPSPLPVETPSTASSSLLTPSVKPSTSASTVKQNASATTFAPLTPAALTPLNSPPAAKPAPTNGECIDAAMEAKSNK